jgi:hypothetical protein
MYDLRRSAQKLADAKESPAAHNALKALNQDIEDLNVAARRKQVRAWVIRLGRQSTACGL